MIYGLTYLGVFHTIISLMAVGAGAVALIRDGKISRENQLGRFYIITTVVVCLTGFGIFQHGGFGKPHVLGIITLVVLGIAWLAGGKSETFGRFSPYIETVAYSMTFFFHIVPAITETATRLPLDSPLAASPEDPHIQEAIGICFILYLIGVGVQIVGLRKKLAKA